MHFKNSIKKENNEFCPENILSFQPKTENEDDVTYSSINHLLELSMHA